MSEKKQDESDRLSRLEAIVEGIGSDLDRLTKNVMTIADRLSDRAKTDWGMLASWAGVLLLIIGLAGSSFIRDLSRVEDLQQKALENYREHTIDGHPDSVISKVDLNRRADISQYTRIRSIEETLARTQENLSASREQTREQLKSIQQNIKDIKDSLALIREHQRKAPQN